MLFSYFCPVDLLYPDAVFPFLCCGLVSWCCVPFSELILYPVAVFPFCAVVLYPDAVFLSCTMVLLYPDSAFDFCLVFLYPGAVFAFLCCGLVS